MKFTIRDALFVTALVAVALGWGIDRMRRASSPLTTPQTDNRKYEVLMSGKDQDKLYLFDPRTGQIWERYGSGEWTNYAHFPEK